MSDETVLTLNVDAALHARFMAAAEAAQRPASEILRAFMEAFVERQPDAQAHDAWFRREVEEAVRQADDPNVERIPHEEVASAWRRQRADLVQRGGARAG